MTLSEARRDRFRRIAWRHRSKPGEYGLRVHTVAVVLGAWSGTNTGDGVETSTETAVLENHGQPPKVRWLNGEEIAVGGLASGTIEIGPITPDCSVGGTTFGSLLGDSLSAGGTLHLLITGPTHPNGALYTVTGSDAGKALHYTIQAKPVSDDLR